MKMHIAVRYVVIFEDRMIRQNKCSLTGKLKVDALFMDGQDAKVGQVYKRKKRYMLSGLNTTPSHLIRK